ncbi:hypothetical protein SAMD00019534_101820 [Acytostelium subglobosum LB1]|uniref:hypothetical protein n=1 Tax=Acytostelium subglobosum LB1 TaxID=1410327 RepID=UPI00064506B2|nr:hypothetical protein SAMD00019534_101820 [Acytostelium subglobosum LB1]GAM27007.1 hypothetical protein SAMD00019534_101820 [Acytostelium subglobosum LB1]|eukprot:XP_012749887.1 hypothetical protein SAMD00019534_101820 [Acytostelium subglobosum LB1]
MISTKHLVSTTTSNVLLRRTLLSTATVVYNPRSLYTTTSTTSSTTTTTTPNTTKGKGLRHLTFERDIYYDLHVKLNDELAVQRRTIGIHQHDQPLQQSEQHEQQQQQQQNLQQNQQQQQQQQTEIKATNDKQLHKDRIKQLKSLGISFDNNLLPISVSESLTNDQITPFASQNMLLYFGNLVYSTVISEVVKEHLDTDIEIKKEFTAIAKSASFLSRRADVIGLAKVMRMEFNDRESRHQQTFIGHYRYKCLGKFMGALYLEQGFDVVNNFIRRHVLLPSNTPLESYVLQEPESQVIQKFFQYKMEPPIITSRLYSAPVYRSSIESGNQRLVESYGCTEQEARYNAFESLQTHCSSLTSILTLLMASKPKIDKSTNINKKSTRR